MTKALLVRVGRTEWVVPVASVGGFLASFPGQEVTIIGTAGSRLADVCPQPTRHSSAVLRLQEPPEEEPAPIPRRRSRRMASPPLEPPEES